MEEEEVATMERTGALEVEEEEEEDTTHTAMATTADGLPNLRGPDLAFAKHVVDAICLHDNMLYTIFTLRHLLFFFNLAFVREIVKYENCTWHSDDSSMRCLVALLRLGGGEGRLIVGVGCRTASARQWTALASRACLLPRGPRAADSSVTGARTLSTSTVLLFGGRVPGVSTRGDWDSVAEVAVLPVAPTSELASAGLGGHSPVGRTRVCVDFA